jgi:hypothetical protein
VPRVGYLGYERSASSLFEQALKDLGWEDGRNITLEWRFTLDPVRLPTLAAELVRLNPDVIVAPDEARVNAVRQVTHTIYADDDPSIATVATKPCRRRVPRGSEEGLCDSLGSRTDRTQAHSVLDRRDPAMGGRVRGAGIRS